MTFALYSTTSDWWISNTSSSTTATADTWVVPHWVQANCTPIAIQLAPAHPPREFNRFINASDLLEEFIRWLGSQGVKQGEVMNLPLELFVKWLVIRACEQDGEEPGVSLELPGAHRCLGCQRFMRRGATPFHGSRCAGFYYERQNRIAA